MGSVGTPEILLVLAIALLLFGPSKLPEMGRTLGKALREFKKASADLRENIENEVDEIKSDVKDLGGHGAPRVRGGLPAPPRATAGKPPPAMEEKASNSSTSEKDAAPGSPPGADD